MNSIVTAMTKAGIQLPPNNKRVWLWLKDHPGKTAAEVSAALGISKTRAAGTLYELVQRGMASKHTDVTPKSAGRGSRALVYRYTCKHSTWELLPLPLKKPTKQVQPLFPTTLVNSVLLTPEVVVPITAKTNGLVAQAIQKFQAETGLEATETQIVAMLLRRYLK